METTFTTLLILHIGSGFIALVVAPLAMMANKGGDAHKRWGKTFFWSMMLITFTALMMSVYKINFFLLMLAVFSFYLAASGYRAIYRRHVKTLSDVKIIDWLLIGISGMVCFILFVYGLVRIFHDPFNGFGYIASVFGFTGSRLAIGDVKNFTIPNHHRKNWLYHHMGNMVGAYIATVSAFSAVNFSFLPDVIRWLWPTVIGVPLLLFWIRKYRKKRNNSQQGAPGKTGDSLIGTG